MEYLYIYLLKISNSTFTVSFFLRFIRLVNFKVCGITFTSKELRKVLEIVRDTPLIATDAFSTKNLLYLLFLTFNLINQVLSKIFIFLILATVSTCPCVKLPDIFLPNIIDFSKLII